MLCQKWRFYYISSYAIISRCIVKAFCSFIYSSISVHCLSIFFLITIYLSFYPFNCLPICSLSIHIIVYISVHYLSICPLCIYLDTHYLSICSLYVYLFIIYLYVHYLSIHPIVNLSNCLYIFLLYTHVIVYLSFHYLST